MTMPGARIETVRTILNVFVPLVPRGHQDVAGGQEGRNLVRRAGTGAVLMELSWRVFRAFRREVLAYMS